MYMRAFAEAYPDEQFVQAPLAQITWGHNVLKAVQETRFFQKTGLLAYEYPLTEEAGKCLNTA